MFRHKPPTTRKQGYILRYMTKNYKLLKKKFLSNSLFFFNAELYYFCAISGLSDVMVRLLQGTISPM